MLYVLSAPDGRVALLHLEDLDRWSTARHHPSNPLRRKPLVRGVPVDQILVLGVCGQHGAVYELEAAERLVEGEDVASDRLAEPPRSDSDGGYRCDAASTWFSPPSDWDARLRAEDVGLFRVPRPLTELRDRGSLPHPRCPSDGPAYDEAAAMIPIRIHSKGGKFNTGVVGHKKAKASPSRVPVATSTGNNSTISSTGSG